MSCTSHTVTVVSSSGTVIVSSGTVIVELVVSSVKEYALVVSEIMVEVRGGGVTVLVYSS